MAENEYRCPLCREILIPGDDDTVVNSLGLAFDLECWTELARCARKEGIDPDSIMGVEVDEQVENVTLTILERRKIAANR
jgi:hypothetical protein